MFLCPKRLVFCANWWSLFLIFICQLTNTKDKAGLSAKEIGVLAKLVNFTIHSCVLYFLLWQHCCCCCCCYCYRYGYHYSLFIVVRVIHNKVFFISSLPALLLLMKGCYSESVWLMYDEAEGVLHHIYRPPPFSHLEA